MTGMKKKKFDLGKLDCEISLRTTCGKCNNYDKENEKCPPCFPNIKLEFDQPACLCFVPKQRRA